MPLAAAVLQGRTWQRTMLGSWWHELEQRDVVLHAIGSSSLMPGWDRVSGVRYEP